MKQCWHFTVHRLAADGYSVPRGAHGVIEKVHKSGNTCTIRWLPPNTGSSLPVVLDDLVETNTPLTIPADWVVQS